MAKFLAIFVIFGVVSISLCEPARFATRSFNQNRFFARQEVAPSADDQATNSDAPYPAAGKPEGPAFELPNEPAQPSNEYGPPSNEYGPPSSSDPAAPEQTDANPDAAPEEPEAERLVFIRGSNGARISAIPRSRFAKLQARPAQYQLLF